MIKKKSGGGYKMKVRILRVEGYDEFEFDLNGEIKDGWKPKWETFRLIKYNDDLVYCIILTKE